MTRLLNLFRRNSWRMRHLFVKCATSLWSKTELERRECKLQWLILITISEWAAQVTIESPRRRRNKQESSQLRSWNSVRDAELVGRILSGHSERCHGWALPQPYFRQFKALVLESTNYNPKDWGRRSWCFAFASIFIHDDTWTKIVESHNEALHGGEQPLMDAKIMEAFFHDIPIMRSKAFELVPLNINHWLPIP